MKPFDLIKKMSLSSAEGWSYVPFASGSNSEFYTDILENRNITLAWVAVTKNFSELNLKNHHLKREKSDELGITNSLPRLIIVTDESQWLLSKAGDDSFKSVKFTTVLISLYHELKEIALFLNTYKPSKILQEKLKSSMDRIKQEVRNYGESIPEVKKQKPIDLFTGTGQVQKDIKSDLMPYFKLSSKDEQLDRYTKILHEILFRNVNHKQLQFLLKFPDNDVYVNPLYKKGELFIYITKHFFRDEQGLVNHKSIFLIVDKYAFPRTFHPSIHSYDEIIPNLLKINTDLINEYLTKEPF